MILVLLGTQDKPFKRLLEAVEKAKKEKIIKDKVIAQIGCTIFKSEVIETFDYKEKEEIEKLIDKAKLIITHAGVGTIIECISKNKKVIVVPRRKKNGEHTNDHQLEITKEFEEKKYISAVYNLNKLSDVLREIDKFKPDKYVSNNKHFKNKIKEYIDNI